LRCFPAWPFSSSRNRLWTMLRYLLSILAFDFL
jgi:hypothetical protein